MVAVEFCRYQAGPKVFSGFYHWLVKPVQVLGSFLHLLCDFSAQGHWADLRKLPLEGWE
jgi:hypothetical protein